MELFPVTKEETEEIHQLNGVDEERIREDVKILEEWLKKQPHLPQKLPYDRFFEKMMLQNKFSIERTKEKVDNHFTLKNANREFWELFAGDKFILPSKNTLCIKPLPKLGPNKERIFVFDFKKDRAKEFENDHFILFTVAMLELLLLHDLANGVSVVFDLRNYAFEHAIHTDLPKTARLITLLTEGCSSKVHGIHLLHPPSYVEVVVNCAKTVMTQKLISKFKVHKSIESLHKLLPEKYVPEELSGTAGSLRTVADALDDVMLKSRQHCIDSINYVSDESRRVGKSKYDALFGMDGTFKKLNVD